MMYSITIIVVTVVITGAERSSVTCEPGWYYDSVIDRCDTCDSICDHAEIQGTVADCLYRCPGFIAGELKPTDSTRWPTSPPFTANEHKWTQQATLALLLSLTSVCVVLVTVICAVLCVIFRKHGLLQQRTNLPRLHSCQDTDSMRTENSERLLLEGQSDRKSDPTFPEDFRTETV